MNGRLRITKQVVLRVHPLEDPPYEKLERMRDQPSITGEVVRWSCRKCWSIAHRDGRMYRLIHPDCNNHARLIPEG